MRVRAHGAHFRSPPSGLLTRVFGKQRANTSPRDAVRAVLCNGDSMSVLPQSAVEIARPFGLPITNSMVVTWIVAIALIVFAHAATRNMSEVPGGAQNFLESAR